MVNPKRGEIYSVNFAKADKCEIAKDRPVLIIQNDIGNKYSPTTIVVAIHTADITKDLPVCVLVKEGVSGLNKDSVIDTAHIYTIDKSRLGKFWGDITKNILDEVDNALRICLSL